MSFNFRDVTVDPRSGAFIDVLGGPGVVFIRALVDTVGNLWTVEVSNTAGAGVQLTRDGQPYRFFPGPYGYGMALLRLAPDGTVEVYLQGPSTDGGGTCVVSVVSVDGAPLRSYVVPYSSMGLLTTAPDGTPIPDAAEHVEVSNGVPFYHPTKCQGFTVGLGQGGGPNGSINVAKPDGSIVMFVAPSNIPLPPRIAVNANGDFAVVGSFEDAPPSSGMVWVPYAEAPPVVVTPPALIDLPDFGQLAPCWTGPVYERPTQTTQPMGNCSWSDAPQVPRDRPIAEWFGLFPTNGRPALMAVISTEDKELQGGN